jgi:pilus assembly protein CpaB
LTSDLFVQKPKPLESLPEIRIMSETEFEGKTNTVTIFKDQFLIPDFLIERRVEILSTIVPPNKRAATISINKISGVGGHLVPGDNVDVIGSFDEEIAGYPTSLTLFDNLHILAVGAVTTRVTGETAEGEETATAKATNITLSISPQDVKKLVLAEQNGELKLALRGTEDNIPIPPSALTLPTLLQDMGVDPFEKEREQRAHELALAEMEARAKQEPSKAPAPMQGYAPPGGKLEDVQQRSIKVFLGSEEKDFFLVESETSSLADLDGQIDSDGASLEDREKEIEKIK